MRKFTLICNFQNQKTGYDFYVGEPDSEFHHVYHQNKILSNEKGGNIDQASVDCLIKIQKIAKKINVSTPELVIYLLGISSA